MEVIRYTFFLFKYYWYNIDRGIRVDSHHGLVEINKRGRFNNINDIFVFAKQDQQVYYTYTHSYRKDHNRVNWLFVVKTKSRSHVRVVKAGNDEVIEGDGVFQIDELVVPYRVIKHHY